jgi:hypothetical protein
MGDKAPADNTRAGMGRLPAITAVTVRTRRKARNGPGPLSVPVTGPLPWGVPAWPPRAGAPVSCGGQHRASAGAGDRRERFL